MSIMFMLVGCASITPDAGRSVDVDTNAQDAWYGRIPAAIYLRQACVRASSTYQETATKALERKVLIRR